MSVENAALDSHHPDNKLRRRLTKRAALGSLSVAVILMTVKFAGYLSTGSVSLLSSLMDSAFDALASLITLIGIIHAATPADADHRYGHGKLEAIAALCQGIFVLGSGLTLVAVASQRMIAPEPVSAAPLGIAIMTLSILLTIALLWMQNRAIRATQSIALSADRLHYQGDLGTNIGVIAALGLGQATGWPYFDPLFALGVALLMLKGAIHIGRQAFDVLLDRELSDEKRAEIVAIVQAVEGVIGVHDLRTRHAGDRDFIEFHIEVDPNLSITAVHDIMNAVEAAVFARFQRSEVLIHPEPAGLQQDHRIDDRIRC